MGYIFHSNQPAPPYATPPLILANFVRPTLHHFVLVLSNAIPNSACPSIPRKLSLPNCYTVLSLVGFMNEKLLVIVKEREREKNKRQFVYGMQFLQKSKSFNLFQIISYLDLVHCSKTYRLPTIKKI